jgi:hypothetical protein
VASPAPVSPLQAYNHLKGASQSWIVVPFSFTARGKSVEGTIKLLWDPYRGRPLALSLVTSDMAFHLPLEGRPPTLSVSCTQSLRPVVERAVDDLRPDFNHMGMEVDDTINERDAFDGFSPLGEGVPLPSVDTVG